MCIFAKVNMDHWNEIRTAYQVVRLGTISAAAEALGVHRATVIRHIDTLEAALGDKLFQRHARGYTPTEAGQDLLRVAQTTDEQFTQLAARTKGRTSELSGELVITSLEGAAPELLPAINAFQQQYPNVIIRYITSDRVFKLEYGEAHIAIRAGAKPNEPDNVVQSFAQIKVGLYASQTYVEKYGIPNGITDFQNHRFVGPNNPDIAAPFFIWMRDNIPQDCVILRSTSQRVLRQAILSGTGIGFLPSKMAQDQNMIEVIPSMEDWQNTYWLVTHVDLHRTAKVQAFLNVLKNQKNIR